MAINDISNEVVEDDQGSDVPISGTKHPSSFSPHIMGMAGCS